MKISNMWKRTTKLIVALSIVLTTLMITFQPINAEGDFVVKDIATNGTMTTINSYPTFDEAHTAMLTYPNGVITHNASLSPTKIIAMTRGVAVSYTFRYGSLSDTGYTTDQTMIITQYQTATLNQKNTYVGSHYDMQYLQTMSYDAATGNGRVHVIMSGFNGYADLKQLDLVPMVYLENNLPISLGGSTFNPVYEEVFTLNSPKQVQFVVSGNELIFQRWSFYSGVQRNNTAIGIKAEWMTDGATYYSYDFNNFYSDRECKTLVGTYYNYYQYLPLRSKTNITSTQLNTYLASKKTTGLMLNNAQLFINAQNTYGVNALLLYAIAIQESNYGTSDIALRTNNLFGINAIDSDPSQATTFPSVEACINDMAGWFIRRYMDINDWRFFGSHLGTKESGFNVKYASDPYWGVQISAIAYSIDKTYNLVDNDYYSIGVINTYNVPVKSQASATSSTWYTSAYGATYQQDFTVILNKIDNSFYQVPTTNPIENGTLTTLETVRRTYDFLGSIGYIEATKINLISDSRYTATTANNPITAVVYPEYITDGNILSLSTFTFDDNGLDLAGHGFNKGVAVRSLTDVSHALVFKHTTTSEEYVFNLSDGVLTSSINTTYPIKDLSFAGSTFVGNNIDLTSLVNGEYEVLIRIDYASYLDTYDMNINLTTIPDLAAITPSLVFRETDNKLYLDVNRVIEGELATAISTFEWGIDEHSNELFIEGIAAIREVDHNDRSRITHKLIIYNIENNTEYEYLLETHSGEEVSKSTPNLYDGYSYYYSWFNSYIDLSTLPVGEYRADLYVEVISSDEYTRYTARKSLRNTQIGNIPSINHINGNTILINKNGKVLSRYEISVIEGLTDIYSLINKPTSRITYTALSKLELLESSINVEGAMYLYNTDHNETHLPSFRLYFVKDGLVKSEIEMTTTTGKYDLTPLISSGNDYTYAWYDKQTIDLSSLENGTYKIFVSISLDSYFEIIPLYDIYDRYNIESTTIDKKYTFEINENQYDRLTLTISDYVPE